MSTPKQSKLAASSAREEKCDDYIHMGRWVDQWKTSENLYDACANISSTENVDVWRMHEEN